MKLIIVQIMSLVALVAGAPGNVDDSRPDLSMFHLKRVRADELESIRSGEAPIRNLDTGAIVMREVLFSANQVARCSAYAHLLKLVASHQEESDTRINQVVVLALAMVSDADADEYEQLMARYQPESSPSLRQLFKRTIEGLERRRSQTSSTKGAWLELIDCAQQLDLGLDEFLARPHRQAQAQRYRQFKALPAELNDDVDDTTNNKPEPARVSSSSSSSTGVESARATLEQLDDDELRQLRADIRSANSRHTAHADKVEQVEQVEQVEEKRTANEPGNEPDEDSAAPDVLELEITIPVVAEEEEEEKEAPAKAQAKATTKRAANVFVVADHMTLMTFIKSWLALVMAARQENVAVEQPAKLNVNSAVGYVQCWRELETFVQEHSSDEEPNSLIVSARDYFADRENKLVAKRMQLIVDNFVQVAEAMADLEERKKFNSMEELEQTYGRLISLLRATDPAVDMYDVTRVILSSREKELHKFRVLNRFIERDSW